MSEEDNLDYTELQKRIKQAKSNPFYGIDKNDVGEFTKVWFDSYKNLRKANRRTIQDNVNYKELMLLISKYPHRKSNVGYMIYLNNRMVSVLGGEGAFCNEYTFEIAILNEEGEFITGTYDTPVDNVTMSLQYQTLEDLSAILDWCMKNT